MLQSEAKSLAEWQTKIPLGRYQHYHGGFYTAVGFVWLEASQEWAVEYIPADERYIKRVVRSCREWIEEMPLIEMKDFIRQKAPRFSKVEDMRD